MGVSEGGETVDGHRQDRLLTTNDHAIETTIRQILQLLKHRRDEGVSHHRKKHQLLRSILLHNGFLTSDGERLSIEIFPLKHVRKNDRRFLRR